MKLTKIKNQDPRLGSNSSYNVSIQQSAFSEVKVASQEAARHLEHIKELFPNPVLLEAKIKLLKSIGKWAEEVEGATKIRVVEGE